MAETYRLGFEERAYSYSPTGFPTSVWAKVVEREICTSQRLDPQKKGSGKRTASMTAPVTGSWGLPAWTARVPKPCTGEGARGGVSMGCSEMVMVGLGRLLGGIVWKVERRRFKQQALAGRVGLLKYISFNVSTPSTTFEKFF
jgi:hypothetical protein